MNNTPAFELQVYGDAKDPAFAIVPCTNYRMFKSLPSPIRHNGVYFFKDDFQAEPECNALYLPVVHRPKLRLVAASAH